MTATMAQTGSLHERVLVTGGAGFIGSALVEALVRDGVHVLTIDKLSYAGRLENLKSVMGESNHEFLHADIADREPVRHALSKMQPQAVYHLAAESHVDRSIDSPLEFLTSNVLGTGLLLEEVRTYWRQLDAERRRTFRFLQVSTDEVFGSLGADGVFDQNSPFRPNSPYAASKAAADLWSRACIATYDMPIMFTHCGNNFGPRQLAEKLIPLTILNALAGRRLPLYGNGSNIRDWIHVLDHVGALRRVMSRGVEGNTYLIGARDEWSNRQLVESICGILDELLPGSPQRPHRNLIELVEDRPGHDFRYGLDPSSIESLGWTAARSVERDLPDVVRWYVGRRDLLEDEVKGELLQRQGLKQNR